MNWILSNFPGCHLQDLSSRDCKSFFICVDDSKKIINLPGFPGRHLLIDGYVLPRTNVSYEFSDYCDEDLVIKLYEKYGNNFIKYVKGYFTILIFGNSEFQIYGDRFAIKKFLYAIDGNRFFLTNNIELCPEEIFVSFNLKALYLNCLFHHLVDGDTFFKSLKHNTVGLKICLKDNKLAVSK
jgi:hypothetical protein